jgi:Domain of unknown function (DUF4331)
MSSHREAPEISKDPVADSADLYAFVSPDPGGAGTVTIIANYVPLQGPDGGPNFYSFGDDVQYAINIDNDGDGDADISFQFSFQTTLQNPDSFLYNTGPIESLTDPNWNRRQTYTVTRVDEHDHGWGRGHWWRRGEHVLGEGLACPPCNIGPLSTPDYAGLAQSAVTSLGHGITVFAGQRADGFYVDLGSIFDLGILRPFEGAHNLFGIVGSGIAGSPPGVNATKALNVHSIAIQIPIAQLTANGNVPTDPTQVSSVIGVWTSASRQKVHVREGDGVDAGPWVQVSRLGNPLINEVIIPLGQKDYWNTAWPGDDKQFSQYYANPELARLLPVLYPGVFPNLATYNAGTPSRADLEAILLTGIPTGVVPGFQNYTGPNQADLLRLNVAVPPASAPSNLGLLGGDVAGFPNGRRVFDDVVTIEVRAVAGATLPLVDPSFTADGAAGAVNQGLTSGGSDLTADGTESYLSSFPYLGVPHSGFSTPSS